MLKKHLRTSGYEGELILIACRKHAETRQAVITERVRASMRAQGLIPQQDRQTGYASKWYNILKQILHETSKWWSTHTLAFD